MDAFKRVITDRSDSVDDGQSADSEFVDKFEELAATSQQGVYETGLETARESLTAAILSLKGQ